MNNNTVKDVLIFVLLAFGFIGLCNIVTNHFNTTQNRLQLIAEQLEEQNELIREYNYNLEEYKKLVEKNKIENTNDTVLNITADINENITLNKNTDSVTNTIEASSQWEIGEEVPLPNIPTNMKFCTDYRWYGIEGTPHKRLQEVSYTDELGCRKYNNDYCVALGSFYSNRIGDRFEVTLDTGVTFTVITADMKADIHTDSTNRYAPCVNYEGQECANVLEFIIDKNVVSNEMYAYGSLDYYDYFKGNVVKMTYLGRDRSQDWDIYE